ncbi:MAG TPA: hypothetical protein VKB35_02180 [Ktedonobacteraceae bacterium]|nr:hypothetical protein [Ktedonobacteraceae bacterium]
METEPIPLNLKYQLAPLSGIVRAQAPQPASTGGDEGAGSGQATGVTDLKGLLLTKVQVQLIFWGTKWGQASPSTGDVTKAVQNILSGSYMQGLSQYRGIGPGTLLGTTVVTPSNPPQPFSSDDVAHFVLNLIATGKVPKPADGQQSLYCVILPVGVSSNLPDVNGIHSYIYNVSYSFPLDVDLDKVFYAWVMNDGTLDGITVIFSHELAEACSDPDGNGIQVLPLNPNSWHEIGDVCEGISGVVNGVSVQAYWSQSSGACVIPGLLAPSPGGAQPYIFLKE